LIEIGSKTAEKNPAQTNRQTDRHYENNGHLAVNQYSAVPAKYATARTGPIVRTCATTPILLSAADALECHIKLSRIKNSPAMRPFDKILCRLIIIRPTSIW